jgi:hypothetical protein
MYSSLPNPPANFEQRDSTCHTERLKTNREGRARATYYDLIQELMGVGPTPTTIKKVIFTILGPWLVLFIYVLCGIDARHIKPKA